MAGDGSLGRRLAADLDATFPDIVRTHQGRVYSIALQLTGAPAEAEDAAQDAFVRAYRALQGYGPDRRAELALRPWLAQITLNVCRNRARSASRRPRTAPLDEGAEPPAAPGDSSDGALRNETAGELAAALALLPEPQRRAIVLHHAGELTYREVALVVGRPEGTVKADVHRGLGALRSILQLHSRELPA
ncbi:MAG: RNA polymerase sigma factor [Actinobacteria bacterium]|nr:RNA polymerase sigma factor [Actinomycetota bacterium]